MTQIQLSNGKDLDIFLSKGDGHVIEIIKHSSNIRVEYDFFTSIEDLITMYIKDKKMHVVL